MLSFALNNLYRLIFQIKMNSLIGDSRTKGLKVGRAQHLINDLWCIPGAPLSRLEDEIRNSVILHHGNDYPVGKHHIYISAGICNVTQRLRDRNINYEEVIFDSSTSQQLIDNTTEQILRLKKIARYENAEAIFCTLYPMSLKYWNNNRLNQNKTSFLRHSDKYKDMQFHLNKAVEEINEKIFQINKSSNFSTPQFHKQLTHNRNKFISYKFNSLTDGCHPDNTLKHKLANSLTIAIHKNRAT